MEMSTDKIVHLMTGSSSVRCGLKMRHWETNPDGWDMGTATTEVVKVTCPKCLDFGR